MKSNHTLARLAVVSLLSLASAAHADQIDETEGECIPTGMDGQLCAVSQEVGAEWRDGNWVQVGQDSWVNETDGTVSHWVEIAPNEYEIMDPVEQAGQAGLEIPLPAADEGLTDGDGSIDLGTGDLGGGFDPMPTGEPIVHFEFGDGTSDDLGGITGDQAGVGVRVGPFGVTRLVVKAPKGIELEEFELVWAIYKARLNARRFDGLGRNPLGNCDGLICSLDDGSRVYLDAATDGYLSRAELDVLELQSRDAFNEAVTVIDLAVYDTEAALKQIIHDQVLVESYIEALKKIVGPRPPEGQLDARAIFHEQAGPLVVNAFVGALLQRRASGGQMTWGETFAAANEPVRTAFFGARGALWNADVDASELGFGAEVAENP